MANERVQCLVAFERFQTWWPLEGEGKTSFSPLLTSPPPRNFTYTFFFPLTLRFYFTMVLYHYFTPLFPFVWPINYNNASQCIKSSTHSSLSWFWSKIFSFPWIHDVVHDHVLLALNHVNEWKTALGVIPRLDINMTSSWWKSRTTRSAPSSWVKPLQAWYYCISLNSHSLVLLHFFELS